MNLNKTRAKYTPEELADAVVFPVVFASKQQKSAERRLRSARKKVQSGIGDRDRLVTDLLQLRFQLEDYLTSGLFDPKLRFSYFLKEYVRLLNKKRKIFAEEININETELSQLINNHRLPGENIIIRLEIHSNNTIPAVAWYKLIEREKEHYINTDKAIRKKEKKNVFNKLTVELV